MLMPSRFITDIELPDVSPLMPLSPPACYAFHYAATASYAAILRYYIHFHYDTLFDAAAAAFIRYRATLRCFAAFLQYTTPC